MNLLPSHVFISFSLALSSLVFVGCNESDASNQTVATTEESSTASPTSGDEVISRLQANLKKSGIETTIISAEKTEINGFYWVTAEKMPPFLVDEQGTYVIQGQIISVGGEKPVDITEKLKAGFIQKKLEAVPKEELIIFPAKGETKAAVFIFTDPTCPYCQKLDNDVKELNENGIEVRYLAWPRSQRALPIMESVWCSDDPKTSLNQSMQNLPVDSKECTSPVNKQSELGFAIGVSGTPAIYNEKGEQLGGYLPPQKLAEALGIQ